MNCSGTIRNAWYSDLWTTPAEQADGKCRIKAGNPRWDLGSRVRRFKSSRPDQGGRARSGSNRPDPHRRCRSSGRVGSLTGGGPAASMADRRRRSERRAPRTSTSPVRVGSPACEVPSTQLPRSVPTYSARARPAPGPGSRRPRWPSPRSRGRPVHTPRWAEPCRHRGPCADAQRGRTPPRRADSASRAPPVASAHGADSDGTGRTAPRRATRPLPPGATQWPFAAWDVASCRPDSPSRRWPRSWRTALPTSPAWSTTLRSRASSWS